MTSQGVSAVQKIAPATTYSSSRSTVTTSSTSTQSAGRSYSETAPTDLSSVLPRRQGLSPGTYVLAEQILLPEHEHLRHEKAVLLSGGLRWLLESATKAEKSTQRTSMSHGLTAAAVRTFNRIEDGKKSFVREEANRSPAGQAAKGSGRTEDWVLGSDV